MESLLPAEVTVAAIRKILERFDENQKLAAEQLIVEVERRHRVRTAEALAKLSIADIAAVELRNPFIDLDEESRTALARTVLTAAKELVQDERKREEKRRSRPAVALGDFAESVRAASDLKDAWKAASVESVADLLKPAAAKVLLDKNVPLAKRREVLALSKLAAASRNLKLSESLYREGVSSLGRLARMPKARLNAILQKNNLDEDSRRDAIELQRRARLAHRRTQAIAVNHGSGQYNFGPNSAHVKKADIKAFHQFFELRQDPLEVSSSCASCTECENAFSPLGYLFDLLDFINDQWQVTVDDLERILLQKIKDLDCQQAGMPTAQIRVAIQILEKFIGAQILRNNADWQTQYRAASQALVQLLSQELELDPALTNVAELAADQRFTGNEPAQALIGALSSPSPALAELDQAEQALRALVVAAIDAAYPLPQEPGTNASDDEMIAYLLERSRQEQSRYIEKQEFEKRLAQILEVAWVDYRERLIGKTQKTAKELENLLFIHLTAAPCHHATPITQLILSLQAFVLAVRTGEIAQLKQTARLGPIIGGKDFAIFDEEIWNWLETYAKWSAAIYAFLYPENLMGLPSLRPSISPPFTEALETLSLSASAARVEEALQAYELHLRSLNRLELLSAHIVADKLYVFARQGSYGDLLMNTVDLINRIAGGWTVAVKHKENFSFVTVGPRYLGEKIEFIAGATRHPPNGGLAFRTFLIPLRDESQSGRDVPLPDNLSEFDLDLRPHIEPTLDGDGHPATHAVWAGRRENNKKVYCRSSLAPDGGWSPPTMVDQDSDGPAWAPQRAPASILGSQLYHADINPGIWNQLRVWNDDALWTRNVTVEGASFVATEARLASHLTGAQTCVVCSTEEAFPSHAVMAVSRIDVESRTLENDWIVISIGYDDLQKLVEDNADSAGTATFPILLRNVYYEERYLYFPLMAAWALNRSGDYANAHDWLRSIYNPFDPDNREGFPFVRYFSGAWNRAENWLGDALNPHNLARQRSGVYLRHVILAMVKNLLDWADHEFTLNHRESLNRAGELYRLAEQVLQAPELNNPCQDGLMALEFEIGRRYGLSGRDLFVGLEQLPAAAGGKQAIDELLMLVKSGKKLATIKRAGQGKIETELKSVVPVKFSERLESRHRLLESLEHHLLATDFTSFVPGARTGSFQGRWATSTIDGRSVEGITLQIDRADDGAWRGLLMGRPLDQMAIDERRASMEFLQRVNGLSFRGALQGDEIKGEATSIVNNKRKPVILQRLGPALDIGEWADIELEPVTVTLCMPPNPLLAAFNSHARIGLLALDKCRTISGELQPAMRIAPGALQDTVPSLLSIAASGIADPRSIASDQPRYRYGYLVEQARQRAGLAKQLGDALFAALKERDQAAYDLLLAQNARELAGATRDLKDLVRQEGRDALEIANVQMERAEAHQEFWTDRIENHGRDGLSETERQALQLLHSSARFAQQAAFMSLVSVLPAAAVAAGGAAATATQIGAPVGLLAFLGAMAAGSSGFASALQAFSQADAAQANTLLTTAGFERRWEEWNLQNRLADYDAQIADLQVTLAEDRVVISDKDYEIAGLQYTHAERVYEFLQSKLLNKELYEWMVAVLIEQYRVVMQSATAVAQLGQRALEFEWQAPVAIVKGDYWTVDAPSLREDQKRYGLLGAERLLADLTRLDDFRLSADKRRLQLSKSISLAQRFPSDFVKLQQTGRIEFDTLMDWFDDDFPGHYLRLIKTVRTSVFALVPPIEGIHATLTNTGASTVIFPDRPLQRSLRTFGESIALDSPYNESGLFVLDYNDPMLLPFEGLGVETHWIFELPRASNRWNFDTIADVVFTIEYSALYDADYAARVRRRLGAVRSVNSVLSLRSSFPDQWYHLQNPLDRAQPQLVTLKIPRSFFAPNLQNPMVKHLTVILVPATSSDIQLLRNRFPQNAVNITIGGITVSLDGSAIDPGSASITTMQPGLAGSGNPPFTDSTFNGQNVAPFGDWRVRFASELYTIDTNNTRALDLLADLVLVPTVEGTVT